MMQKANMQYHKCTPEYVCNLLGLLTFEPITPTFSPLALDSSPEACR